jgi:hypothetical protein
MAKGVLLDAGGVVCNLYYDPRVPYYEELLITRPERVCSYEEMKVELDYAKGGTGIRDRCIRDGFMDDGKVVVTKSEMCALVARGRLGDGRALPVYIVFGDDETNDPAWVLNIKNSDILDNEGEPMA